MNKKNIGIIILMVICICLLGAVGYTLFLDQQGNDNQNNQNDLDDDELIRTDIVTVDGVKYKLNSDIETVLFMGIDKEARTDFHNTPGQNGQSDSLNLLILDKSTMKAQILQISRDTVVDIDIYGIAGDKIMTKPGQITLQYAYGDGEKRSCQLTKNKVSELLYGVGIDSYVSLTLEGMIAAADLIGGVAVTIPEDYTYIDPAFQKGSTVVLDGILTEKYVRLRDIEQLESNEERMKRQASYMEALIVKLRSMESTSQLVELYQDLEPYMVTDMTAEEMEDLADYEIDSKTITISGEVIEKDGHAQFIADNKRLQEIVLKLFYKTN